METPLVRAQAERRRGWRLRRPCQESPASSPMSCQGNSLPSSCAGCWAFCATRAFTFADRGSTSALGFMSAGPRSTMPPAACRFETSKETGFWCSQERNSQSPVHLRLCGHGGMNLIRAVFPIWSTQQKRIVRFQRASTADFMGCSRIASREKLCSSMTASACTGFTITSRRRVSILRQRRKRYSLRSRT